MADLFSTGIRPHIDAYLIKKSKEVRSYGDYWSASSAGYCMRKVVFDRLKVPKVKDDARKTRVFESGYIFHEWMQRITKDSGLSIAQELELQDEDLMVRGHFDDLVLVTLSEHVSGVDGKLVRKEPITQKLVLYDYKTQNSRAFSYQKDQPIGYYHRMQLGTYMYMLRKHPELNIEWPLGMPENIVEMIASLEEGRILKISKDDLRLGEQQLMWSLELESDVAKYWGILNGLWKSKTMPSCTCADHDGGFLAREKYNDYFFKDEPCSLEWAKQNVDLTGWKF